MYENLLQNLSNEKENSNIVIFLLGNSKTLRESVAKMFGLFLNFLSKLLKESSANGRTHCLIERKFGQCGRTSTP